jgi:D-inositol-3-phosphate glycosyltransferase
VLCMGTYEPRKGQGALALAFAELSGEFPDAVLALVGDTGIAYAEAVREMVERLELNDRVRLLPVVDDTYAWYAMADAFVSVSDVESLPRSVLEVMAFGVPVLAADVFGLPELIDDGVTGLLCAPRDIEAMVGGIQRLLGATPEERAGLGAGGSDLVHARYDSSGYAAAYRRLLRGLQSNPGALPDDVLAL